MYYFQSLLTFSTINIQIAVIMYSMYEFLKHGIGQNHIRWLHPADALPFLQFPLGIRQIPMFHFINSYTANNYCSPLTRKSQIFRNIAQFSHSTKLVLRIFYSLYTPSILQIFLVSSTSLSFIRFMFFFI